MISEYLRRCKTLPPSIADIVIRLVIPILFYCSFYCTFLQRRTPETFLKTSHELRAINPPANDRLIISFFANFFKNKICLNYAFCFVEQQRTEEDKLLSWLTELKGVPLVKDIATNVGKLDEFAVRDNDVYIISYPKSGECLHMHYMTINLHFLSVYN